jgi:Lar family restriction alleviation protein
MSAATENKPCPFCGESGVIVVEGSTFRWLVAVCGNCDAKAPEARTEQAALDSWNERPASKLSGS